MSRNTRILRWRRRRLERTQRGSTAVFRGCGFLLAALLLGGLVLGVVSVVGTTAVTAAATRTLPDITALEQLDQDVATTFETTKIYAWDDTPAPADNTPRDLTLIYELIDPFGGDRQWVPLQQIPQPLIDATVAIEDKTFWTNPGFDVEGIGRAFYEFALQGGAVQGGSSITQQLVKNTLIEPERRVVEGGVDAADYQRKAEELLLARQIADRYSKDQVLEWYLNTNFYGNLAYGIEAAARVYFDKPAAQLTLPEAAMLAAIPQSPALNPLDNPEAAKQRQELVLDSMVREGYLTQDQALAAKTEPVIITQGIEERYDIIAPHFAQMVRRELEQRFGPDLVLRGGLRVTTTLDLAMQRQAECVARAHLARLSGQTDNLLPIDEAATCEALDFLPPLSESGKDHSVNNTAVVMLDPQTGEIKALVGSRDYWNRDINGSFNVAADGLRQPGSSFKPFTYLTALSQGYTAASMMLDVETDFGTPYNGVAYVPQNYDRQFHGPMRLREALGNSYNVPAVQAMTWVGIDKVLRTAHSLGITSLDQGADAYGLSLTLGGGEVSLLDMVYAYSVMDNMGVMIGQPRPEPDQRLGFRTLDPVTILRVEDRNGDVLYEYSQPQQREILTPQLAYLMNDILSDRSARCDGFGCPNALELPDNRPAAVKTGTTNEYRDAWTVGYTPQLVTGVWVGNTDATPMDDVPGSKGAAPIWHALMSWALQDEPMEGWPRPSGLVDATVCNTSGLLPTPTCPTVNELFIEGTVPTTYDTIYQEFAVNRDTGRLATIYTPPDLIEQRIYKVYPEAAADWVRENEIEQPPTEYDTISAPAPDGGNLAITSPQPFAFVGGTVPISGTVRGEGIAYYRLAHFAGLTPTDVQIIADNVRGEPENAPLGVWNTAGLEGLHTLLLTAVREDGSFDEVSVQVTVDNTPPTADILFPLPDQEILLNDEWVIVQAQVSDDVSLDRVEFYVDGAEVPFAISTVPPFTETWTIPGPGCHSFRVVAVDAVGNEAESTAVNACIVDNP